MTVADTWLKRDVLEALMFGGGRVRRFTQDSPVLPDVWLEYARAIDPPATSTKRSDRYPAVPLLLTPYGETSTAVIAKALRERLAHERVREEWAIFGHDPRSRARVVYTQSTVAVELYFEDLIRVVLPMTDWWQKFIDKDLLTADWLRAIQNPEQTHRTENGDRVPPELLWMMRVAGAIALEQRGETLDPADFKSERPEVRDAVWKKIIDAALALTGNLTQADSEAKIYSISLNREAGPSISRSTLSIKADAARRLFDIRCDGLSWAIIDSGVEATHPAFRKRDKDGKLDGDPYKTRVKATYDFTGLKLLLDPEDRDEVPAALKPRIAANPSLKKDLQQLYDNIDEGRPLEWGLIGRLLRVPHEKGLYYPPEHDHGTHVAGILAGDWRATDDQSGLKDDLKGVCPDLNLYDLRVLDRNGRGDEFNVMAALQFLRHLNATNDFVAVHGANLSLSIPHDVSNYACGRTPVCEEAERAVSAGVVVVAAAGNQGYRKMTVEGVTTELYSSISITDPGNADLVITVGATHRFRPHTYGVSYFSSRGPTGDGRMKPDLVAPGEKISAPIINDSYGLKDGTSMAAPHVSGAAALLMARHNELVSRPARIKQILCATATDLGRERYFQGAGMLDVLRALQSV
jgi:serine protease AprX